MEPVGGEPGLISVQERSRVRSEGLNLLPVPQRNRGQQQSRGGHTWGVSMGAHAADRRRGVRKEGRGRGWAGGRRSSVGFVTSEAAPAPGVPTGEIAGGEEEGLMTRHIGRATRGREEKGASRRS